MQLGQDSVWVEKVKFQSSTAVDLQDMATQHDAFASLLEGLEQLASDDERLQELATQLFGELDSKLPLEWKDPEDGGLNPSSVQAVREALGDVGHILAGQLSRCGETLS